MEGGSRAPEAEYDAAIIGGGPAGSSAAIELARAERRVIVCEREAFPRFHIGESLLPMSNPVFDRLGVRDAVDAAGFTRKHGATLIDETGEHVVSFDFADTRTGQTATWQVPRDRFDALLLAEAAARGAEVRTSGVRGVDVSAAGATLRLESGDSVRARWVIDASGRAGVVASRHGPRIRDETLQKVAIYAHYRGVPRPDGRRGGDVRIVSFGDLGWVWLIPLPDGVTSVGLVTDLSDWEGLRGGGPAATFARALDRVPFMRCVMASAGRISDVHVESSFSYRTGRYSDACWLLAGDAGSFLDPVFSTGVMLALLSGVEAGEAVGAALREPGVAARVLRRFDRMQSRRYRRIRRLVTAFYDPGVRDLLFQPAKRFGLVRAVTAMLAGDWAPSLADRLRLEVFLTLGRVQRHVPLVERLHGAEREVSAGAESSSPSSSTRASSG